MSLCRPKQARAFTLIELLILIVVTGIVLATLWSGLQRSRHGACYIKCRSAMKQVHEGMVMFSQGNNGRYPVPTEISPETARISIASGNSTANIHSVLIFQNFCSSDLLVCHHDGGANIRIKDDCDYGGEGSTLPEHSKWDPSFDCDFRGNRGRESNVSFANNPPL